jgi:hypothetical protein
LGESWGATTAANAAQPGVGEGTYEGQSNTGLGAPGAFANDPDTALDLSGTDNWVDFGDIVDLGSADLSISLWVKSGDSIGYFIGKSDSGMTDGRWGLGFTNRGATGAVNFFVDSGGASDNFYVGTQTIDDGNWHNVVVTVDRSADLKLYVDGVQEGAWDTSSYRGLWLDTDNSLCIGLLHCGFGGTTSRSAGHPFDGLVDDVAVFERPLSADEVALLYQAAQ